MNLDIYKDIIMLIMALLLLVLSARVRKLQRNFKELLSTDLEQTIKMIRWMEQAQDLVSLILDHLGIEIKHVKEHFKVVKKKKK